MLRKLKQNLSPATKRRIKQILFLSPGEQSLTILSGKWLGRQADKILKEKHSIYSTNIKTGDSLPASTKKREQYLDDLLNRNWYTFDDLLVIKDPFSMAPLMALILFQTEQNYSVQITVKGKQEGRDLVSEFPAGKQHRIPIWGLYAAYENQVMLRLFREDGTFFRERIICICTEPLPPLLFDDISVDVKPEENEFILISGGLDVLPCIVDGEGEIRYYIRRNPKGYGIFPISEGRFLYLEKKISTPTFTNPNAVQFYEMDFLGRVKKSYFVEKGCHHDGCEMTPGGNFLLAGSSHREQTEDEILEMDRESGAVVKTLRMEQILGDYYKDRPDWAHINSVYYAEEENAVYVSLRNVHSALKINWGTDELEWILANPLVWEGSGLESKVLKPVGEMVWQYQAHAFLPIGGGKFLLFDNHVDARRPMPCFDGKKESFLTVFHVNEAEFSVSTAKRFSVAKTKIRSNAVLDKENGCIYSMAGFLKPKVKGQRGQIEAYDYESGKLRMRLFVKNGFFRAYPFSGMPQNLAKKMEVPENYMAGTLSAPHFHKPKPQSEGRIEESTVTLMLREDVLYVKAPDHYIEKVYFVNGNETYVKNFDETVQTMPHLFEEYDYSIPIWLKDLRTGKYNVYLKCRGKKLDTGKYIEIRR